MSLFSATSTSVRKRVSFLLSRHASAGSLTYSMSRSSSTWSFCISSLNLVYAAFLFLFWVIVSLSAALFDMRGVPFLEDLSLSVIMLLIVTIFELIN